MKKFVLICWFVSCTTDNDNGGLAKDGVAAVDAGVISARADAGSDATRRVRKDAGFREDGARAEDGAVPSSSADTGTARGNADASSARTSDAYSARLDGSVGSTTPDATAPDAPAAVVPVCGNGIAEGDEECDGADFRGQNCETLGPSYGGGTLHCGDMCQFNMKDCRMLPHEVEPDPAGGDVVPFVGACVDSAMCGAGPVSDPLVTVQVKPWVAPEASGTQTGVAERMAELNAGLGARSHIAFEQLPIGTLPSEFAHLCVSPTDCLPGYVDDDDMFASSYEPGALNIYIVQAAYYSSSFGYAGGWSPQPGREGRGPIVVGAVSPQAFAQENGHYFGLSHTHESYEALCDTPDDPGPCWMHGAPCCSTSWSGLSCGVMCTPASSAPFSHNAMNYYGCNSAAFTNEQGQKARCVLDNELTFLQPACVPTAEICDTVDQNCDGNISQGPCDLPHCAASCREGNCVVDACLPGFDNCNTSYSDGCETDLSRVEHCGRCGNACPPRANAVAICASGSCGFTCNSLWNDCDGVSGNGCEINGPCGGCPACTVWNGSQCAPVVDGTLCASDGNACTSDACQSGACLHTPIICNDGNACTTDTCSAGGCTYTPIVCDDGNFCTTDMCDSGRCVFTPVSCNNSPSPICTSSTTRRTYSSSGTCLSGSCTYPIGDTICPYGCSGGVCLSDPCAGVSCNDGNACTTDTCSGGACVYTPVADGTLCASDGNACTRDACTFGSCTHPAVANDCGSRVCGPSPNGCFSCGTCPSGTCIAATGTCSCTPNWSCGAWSACSCSGTRTRTCTDLNSCGTASGRPTESEGCSTCGNNACDCGETCGSCSGDCATAEVCDGQDNNCNGAVDEGSNACGGACTLSPSYGSACDGSDADYCADDTNTVCAGLNTVACSTGSDNVEVCDGQDNNCNGAVDEGLVCGSDECPFAGAHDCASTTAMRTCGNYDADPYLEWSTPTSCGSSGICSAPEGCFHLETDPPIGNYTPTFTAETNCTCSAVSDCSFTDDTCHDLWRGRVVSMDIFANTWVGQFTSVFGTGVGSTLDTWIAVTGDATPSCRQNDCVAIRWSATDQWPVGASTWTTPTVSIWPSASSLADAACGATNRLYLITDGTGALGRKIWFQRQPITFTKVCP